MKIIVCCKIIPSESSIKFNSDKSLDFSSVECEVSPYDLNAIEAASRLAGQVEGAQLAALTVGGAAAAAPKMKKSILSRGPGELIAVSGSKFDGLDALASAKVLKSAIELTGGADIVICGEGSGDMYNQQTGSMLGALLGAATLNSVSALSMEDGRLIAERSVDGGVELLEVSLPAVLSVTSDINLPRIPSMRDIMSAGKKPSTIFSDGDVPSAENSTYVLSVLAPEKADRKREIGSGGIEEDLNKFCDALSRLV